MSLSPFRVFSDDAEDGSELVWAHDATGAIALARESYLFCELTDTDLYAEVEVVDPDFGPPPSPMVEHRVPWLRAYGWSDEGDDHCEACGLATMDGKFPVCGDCGTCEGCGHATACPRGLLFGDQRFGHIAGRLIYVVPSGPNAPQVHAPQVHRARLFLLNNLLVRLRAHPIGLAPTSEGREISPQVARQVQAAGGGVIALRLESGELPPDAERAIVAANNGTAWGLVGHGREPQPGIAVLRWRDLGPAFEAEGLGTHWGLLCEPEDGA